MGQRLGTFAIVCGALLMLVGLCFLPAAMAEHKDEAILGAGICAFAFGSLLAAGGFYLKAQVLNMSAANGPAKAAPKPVRGGCDLCGTETPAIHCRVHQIHICGNCVGPHYDFRSCVYVPSTRRQTNSKGSARAARA